MKIIKRKCVLALGFAACLGSTAAINAQEVPVLGDFLGGGLPLVGGIPVVGQTLSDLSGGLVPLLSGLVPGGEAYLLPVEPFDAFGFVTSSQDPIAILAAVPFAGGVLNGNSDILFFGNFFGGEIPFVGGFL